MMLVIIRETKQLIDCQGSLLLNYFVSMYVTSPAHCHKLRILCFLFAFKFVFLNTGRFKTAHWKTAQHERRFVFVLGPCILLHFISKQRNKVACVSAGAKDQWERASIKIVPDPPTPPPPFHPQSRESKREREKERGWQARRRRAVPSFLMFPSSSTRSSGEDNPRVRQCASSPGQSGSAGRSRCFFPNFCSICSLSWTF